MQENIGEMLIKYKSEFSLNQELLSVIDKALDKIENRKIEFFRLELFKAIMLALFGKCRKQFKAIQLLCRKGYGEDACILTRSMLNILIDIEYILTDREVLAERYFRYEYVLKNKKIEVLKKHSKHGSIFPPKKPTISEEEILREVKKFKGDYGKNSGDWSGKTIKEKAMRARGFLPMAYDMAYRPHSDLEHSNVASLHSYIKEEKMG